ncbi:MAG TPA: phosphoribosyltransferase family protein [Azospirillaceae bacterium]|nr:phosphoribosyltransferase family protein [Azospirillaceae bacterium]
MIGQVFHDRTEAGRRLAERLAGLARAAPVVLALPRGGVPVGREVADMLGAPLDLLLVRKVGAPCHPELAIGAVAGGTAEPEVYRDEGLVSRLGVPDVWFAAEAARELAEIDRRRAEYLQGRPPLDLSGRTVIVVDDGVATGASIRLALRAARRQRPARLVMAVPVAAPSTLARLADETDEIVAVLTPEDFAAVGQFYIDFHQLNDAEVKRLLHGPSVRQRPIGRAG